MAYRFSSAGVGDISTFLTTYYGDGEADLVVFMIDPQNMFKDIRKGINVSPDAMTRNQNENDESNYSVGWRESLPKEISSLQKSLAGGGTKLVLAFVPDARAVSPLENLHVDQRPIPELDFYSESKPRFFATYAMAKSYAAIIAASGVPMINTMGDLMKLEQGVTQQALFYPIDDHPTQAGNEAIGKLIVNRLIVMRPWQL